MRYYSAPRRALRGVRQLLYPRRCPFCNAVLGSIRTCPDCAEEVDRLRRKPGIRLDASQHYLGGLSGAAAPFRYEGCVRRAILRAKYQAAPWTAVELGVAMPLSWLPLISDYTRDAEKPTQATWVSVLVYGAVSCWMYVIGMGAAIFTGEYDIAVIMVKAGLGIAALIILVFSTVTTTFLDAWSAGISAESLSAKLNGKKTAIAVTVIGTAAAILFPMDDITGFLYLIGSVFAPMIAVQIADHFILHRDRFAVAADARNLVIWLVGFIAYRLLMGVDTPVGYTLPDMVLTVVLCLLAEKAKPTKQM